MRETLTIRLGAETKRRLEDLARRSKRSKSDLATEAIAAYVDSGEWQFGEIEAAMEELDQGRGVEHNVVSEWLGSWGNPGEARVPR